MAYEKYPVSRPGGPFDDSAPGRLRHMGLLTAEGKADQDALAVAARLYAGLFYDDLCDFYNDLSSVNAVCRELQERMRSEDPRMPFLSICSAYDAMYHALPEPVWWMAGNLELVSQFSHGFIRRLSECNEESGVMQ